MKPSIPIMLTIVGLLSVAAIITSALALMRPDDSAQALQTLQQEHALQEARLSALEKRVRALPAEVAPVVIAQRARPQQQPPRPGAADTPAVPHTQAPAVAAQGASAPLLAVTQNPEVREAVQGMVKEGLDIEREERHLRRTTRMKERAREEVMEFAREAGLSREVTEQLTEYVVAEREEMMQLRRASRDEGSSREEARQKMTALRARTDQEVATLLDDEAYALYERERAEEAARFERGRGRR